MYPCRSEACSVQLRIRLPEPHVSEQEMTPDTHYDPLEFKFNEQPSGSDSVKNRSQWDTTREALHQPATKLSVISFLVLPTGEDSRKTLTFHHGRNMI
jgi:hypothetical protein